jgi:hypothetical protein
MQQALLRYYGHAIWCIDHVTKENPYMSQYYEIIGTHIGSFIKIDTCLTATQIHGVILLLLLIIIIIYFFNKLVKKLELSHHTPKWCFGGEEV